LFKIKFNNLLYLVYFTHNFPTVNFIDEPNDFFETFLNSISYLLKYPPVVAWMRKEERRKNREEGWIDIG